jgi:hypothetical protein
VGEDAAAHRAVAIAAATTRTATTLKPMDESTFGEQTSYLAVPKGIPVYAASGKEIGRVKRVLSVPVKNVFDGIVIRTPAGERFVDAPEVGRIYERALCTTLTDEEAESLAIPGSSTSEKARRFGRRTLKRIKR